MELAVVVDDNELQELSMVNSSPTSIACTLSWIGREESKDVWSDNSIGGSSGSQQLRLSSRAASLLALLSLRDGSSIS